MSLYHPTIVLGMGFLVASLYQSRRIGELIPAALLPRWHVLESLIGFFLLGYSAQVLAKAQVPPGPAEYMVGTVYLGGAVFVFLAMRLSRLAMRQIRRDEGRISRLNEELKVAYESTIEGWGRALELRDKETEGHTQRVCELTMRLAEGFAFTPEERRYLKFGALLHDIGKMGVPDAILMKDGPLSEEEMAVMMRHPEHARNMLSGIEFLRPAIAIPYCHHEHWDGSGYPRGLKGEEIPLAARIFAVADVWDALVSERRYHGAWKTEEVCAHILAGSGSQFDPQVVERFLELDYCRPPGG